MGQSIDVAAEVRALEKAFAAEGTPAHAAKMKAYLKSELPFHGVGLPFIRTSARSYQKTHRGLARPELIALVKALWASDYFEPRLLAVALLERYAKLLTSADTTLLERLLRDSHTWALVDWLAATIVGGLVSRDPKLKKTLRQWARDEDFWIRRSALLALLTELRAGEGDFELFATLAEPMLEEKEFFIRKVIGWVLREVSKKRPELVERFLSEHLPRVSGLTLREGSKYLPSEVKARLLSRPQPPYNQKATSRRSASR
jgi:3-methyladenine DNA glycosylase AlkD